MDRSPLSTDEFVEYCQLQARLLFGSVETMATEADDLLDTIDGEMAALQSQLDHSGSETASTSAPESPENPGTTNVDVEALERQERSLTERQARVEALETRIDRYQELASGYMTLAEEVRDGEPAVEDALRTVVQFEAEHDAPASFDERETLIEAVDESGGSRASE